MKNYKKINCLFLLVLLVSGCGSSDSSKDGTPPSSIPGDTSLGDGTNTSPIANPNSQNLGMLAIGDWIQVNFLATDDNGVWDEDILSGIGFFSSITETQWIDREADCTVIFSYSIEDSGRYLKTATDVGNGCPFGSNVLSLLGESGTLEIDETGSFMTLIFDLQPGDDIAGFRFMRQ